jgi:hypothetical protein
MGKKVLLGLLLLALAVTPQVVAEDDLELGVSFVPTSPPTEGEDLEFIWGSHLGYRFWGIFYAGWDALIVPPHMIKTWTPFFRPGYLNLFDAGLRLDIGPLVGHATIGVNRIYVYRQDADSLEFNDNMGANLRLGAGLKLNNTWGFSVQGRSIFHSMDELIDTLRGLGDAGARPFVIQQIRDGLIPTLVVTLYL